MIEYEVSILYHPSLEVDLSKAEEQILKVFANSKAKVVSTDNWGKRKLAYPIKKQDYAIYVFYTVEVEPSEVRKIETTLNITDEIIRYLIVKVDQKAIAAAEAAKAKKESVLEEAESEEVEEKDSTIKQVRDEEE